MSLVTALTVQIIRHKLTVKDVVVNEEHDSLNFLTVVYQILKKNYGYDITIFS